MNKKEIKSYLRSFLERGREKKWGDRSDNSKSKREIQFSLISTNYFLLLSNFRNRRQLIKNKVK